MSLTAKQGPFGEQIEDGNHQAVCVAVIDLGTQYNETFNKEQPKIVFIWELPDFPIDDENGEFKEYRTIPKEYTVSLSEKANLYSDLVSWRGRDFTEAELEGFDVKKVLGANCLLNIVKNKKGYAQVAAVAKMPKNMQPKKGTYQLIYDMDEGIMSIPEGVPEWIVKKIKKSREYQAVETGDTKSVVSPENHIPLNDDIPF